MTVFNFGSINIDHIYSVPHFVRPGETLSSDSLQTVLGGKGANQSVALARAGVEVRHIGRLNRADDWAFSLLEQSGVNTSFVEACDEVSGHAIIQVDKHGENAIVLHGGANQNSSIESIEVALHGAKAGDYLLLQNEVNLIDQAFAIGLAKGMKVVLNPAPMSEAIRELPLEKLDILIVNQIEAQTLSGANLLEDIIDQLVNKFPNTKVVITLGAQGAVVLANGQRLMQSASAVEVVDTTAAGDTFVGYFLAGLVQGLGEQAALQQACQAGALAVSVAGAIPSIPSISDLSK